MSALLDRRNGGSAGSKLALGLPQVNLLPPEVRAARSLGKIKKWLGAGLVATVFAVGLGYGAAQLESSAADSELGDAQAETARLKVEEAKYAEVPQVLTALGLTRQSREIGMSTEITWRTYLDAVAAVLPPDVSIESLSVVGLAPSSPLPLSTDPLQGPSVASITFQGETRTIPDTAAWIDALGAVPGFADPWVSSVTVTEREGVVYYVVSASVQLTDATFAGRFIEDEEAS